MILSPHCRGRTNNTVSKSKTYMRKKEMNRTVGPGGGSVSAEIGGGKAAGSIGASLLGIEFGRDATILLRRVRCYTMRSAIRPLPRNRVVRGAWVSQAPVRPAHDYANSYLPRKSTAGISCTAKLRTGSPKLKSGSESDGLLSTASRPRLLPNTAMMAKL